MGCDKIPHSGIVRGGRAVDICREQIWTAQRQRSWPRRGDLQGSRSQCITVRSNLDFVENIDYPVWRGGRAVDKFAGSKFGQRSVSGAGPAGVTYREVGHSAPVCGA